MAQIKYSKIKVTVDSVADMCLSAFNSISPAIQVLRHGGSFPWEKNPDEAYIGCPDHLNQMVFKLERVGEVVIK